MRTEIKKAVILNTPEKIRDFVNDMRAELFDIDILSGHYVIDAKSIMGIFSLDVSKPVYVSAFVEEEDMEHFTLKLEKYAR